MCAVARGPLALGHTVARTWSPYLVIRAPACILDGKREVDGTLPRRIGRAKEPTVSHRRANELLGYPADARLLIVNADDFGVSHAVNAAILRTLTDGMVRSATLMAPCPWARHAMRLLRDHPEIACGVHLTVVSEFARLPMGAAHPSGPGAVAARRDRLLLQQRSAGRVAGPRQAGRAGGRVPGPDRGRARRRSAADPPRLALPVRRRAARRLRPDGRAGPANTVWRCASSTRPGANGYSGGDCPPSTTGWWTARGWRRRARRTGLFGCCANCRPG